MRKILERVNRETAEKHGIVSTDERDAIPYAEIDERLRDPETFVHRIEKSEEIIADGVVLTSKTMELGEGHFTNVYDISFSQDDSSSHAQIATRKTPVYSHRLFAAEEELLAAINGPFFCLHDGDQHRMPDEIIYNANIRDGGKIFGLPSADRPMLYTDKDGKINARECIARGVIEISNQEIHWEGGEKYAHSEKLRNSLETDTGNKVILFNSACCTIEYEDKNDKKSLRKLNEKLNKTQKNPYKTDIVVSTQADGTAHITKIQHGGGTDFFEGNYILHMPKTLAENFNLGDLINPKSIDDLELSTIDSAVTTGPPVQHFLTHDDHNINHDPSLWTFPPFALDARYARSVIYEDKEGAVHMTVFDAVPRSEKMRGVTPKEAAQFIGENNQWAVFLDGGQSSRITYKNTGGNVEACGNTQYLRLNTLDKTSQDASGKERFMWTNHGRPISSSVQLRKQS